jgi:hypothetical protein
MPPATAYLSNSPPGSTAARTPACCWLALWPPGPPQPRATLGLTRQGWPLGMAATPSVVVVSRVVVQRQTGQWHLGPPASIPQCADLAHLDAAVGGCWHPGAVGFPIAHCGKLQGITSPTNRGCMWLLFDVCVAVCAVCNQDLPCYMDDDRKILCVVWGKWELACHKWA